MHENSATRTIKEYPKADFQIVTSTGDKGEYLTKFDFMLVYGGSLTREAGGWIDQETEAVPIAYRLLPACWSVLPAITDQNKQSFYRLKAECHAEEAR